MRFQIFFIALMLLSGAIMAQKSTDLTVHEWGTFTAQYTEFGEPKTDLHLTVEEPVPDFVFNIGYDKLHCTRPYGKGDYTFSSIKSVINKISIRMETPVLYFYSDTAISHVHVKVGFRQGSINEMYPFPIAFENQEHFGMITKIESIDCGIFDGGFGSYTGKAEWIIDILAPYAQDKLTHSDSIVPEIWSAPRKTQANLIRSENQVEKYIFYRGLGSFENKLKPIYTQSGNLVLKNTTGKRLNFVMVYEKDRYGRRYIWTPHNLESSYFLYFSRNNTVIDDDTWMLKYRESFVDALVAEGLFRDEAEAMLNTWKESYFEKPGVKIFWITPRSLTDGILPLNISHTPKHIERVLVGRTEIDPFTRPSRYHMKDKEILVDQIQYEIYPNPAQQFIRIKHDRNATYPISVQFTDITGRMVKVSESKLDAYIEMDIPIDDLPSGWYYLRIDNGQSVSHRKLLVHR